jgi:FtsP/CotA-like multicopper oxidase with cupredoxin domain
MRPISRRAALTMGGVGLVSTVVGGTGLWHELTTSVLDPVTGETFAEPEVLHSEGGRLEVRLEAALGTHDVAGRRAVTMGYNGGVPGPTLRLRPGDTLRVELVNRLEQVTNLHVHGLHVSPEHNGDNVFLAVEPGRTRQYEYQLPEDHPPGVYWYHPHHHGTVADQLFGGLYGAIIVEDDDAIPVDRERVMVVSDITLDASGSLVAPSTMEQMMGREGDLVLVNGRTEPGLEGRAGDCERWRIVNACTSRYLALRLSGQSSRVVGRDVGRLATSVGLEDVVLAPGNRLDLVVDLTEGSSELTARPVDRGGMMGPMMGGGGPRPGGGGPATLARLRVSAGSSSSTTELPAAPGRRDLREADVDGQRSITFRMGMAGMMGGGGGPMSFTFDGREFDADRIDQQVRLGTVEEWTIGNDSPMDHPFHLHVWPMQLVEVDGQQLPGPVWLDVVNVPARSQVKVRIAFEDFGGRTVYHCHILDHEDRGMMGTVVAR